MSGACVVALTGFVAEAPSADAWVSENCKRPSATNVWSNTSGYNQASADAVDDWFSTSTPLVFSKGTEATAGIKIQLGGFGATGYDGISYRTCSGGIQVAPARSLYNAFYTDAYTTVAKRQVMVHELGHSLGLAHAGGSACSGQPIMYVLSDRYFVCGHYIPQSDDVAGINAIY